MFKFVVHRSAAPSIGNFCAESCRIFLGKTVAVGDEEVRRKGDSGGDEEVFDVVQSPADASGKTARVGGAGGSARRYVKEDDAFTGDDVGNAIAIRGNGTKTTAGRHKF